MNRAALFSIGWTVAAGMLAAGGAREPAVKAPDRDWGAADHGVEARLRPAKVEWGLDEVPTFGLDLRNHGNQRVSQAPAEPFCELEFDGVWYVYGDVVVISMPGRGVPPGGQVDGFVTVSLDRPWVRKDCCRPFVPIENPVTLDKVRLHTPPGKHTVRVSFPLLGEIRPVSGPAEITVLKTDAAAKPGK
jgi:hypothetical protein